MGRRYEYKPGKFGWNFDRCEELVLICAYDDIARFVPPEQQFGWRKEFEDLFYEKGRGVAFHIVDSINQVRKRKAHPLIRFEETDISAWGRERDHDIKAERRRALRDELHALTPTARAKTVEDAWDDVRELPPPHQTFDEYRDRQARLERESEASRQEVSRRLVAASQKPPAAKVQQPKSNGHDRPTPAPIPIVSEEEPLPPITAEPFMSVTRVEKLKRMLALAPSLAPSIIAHLSSDEAVELAERCDDEMRDTLILHALNVLDDEALVEPAVEPDKPKFALITRREAIAAGQSR